MSALELKTTIEIVGECNPEKSVNAKSFSVTVDIGFLEEAGMLDDVLSAVEDKYSDMLADLLKSRKELHAENSAE